MSVYDLIVLGAGSAGLAAARAVKKAGWRVLVVEASGVGGTCPLRGCVPKKVLVAAAQALDVIARAAGHGIEVDKPQLNWPRLISRVESFTEGASDDFEAGLASQQIELLKGSARFVDRRIVEVNGVRYEGRYVLVATGSTPRPLAFPGNEHMVTSDELLSRPVLPQSLAFVGAGVVAMELSHVFARAGCRVTLLELGPRPLAAADPDAVTRLVAHSEKLGIRVETEAVVRSVEQRDDGFAVHYERQGRTEVVFCQLVANGSGRVANISALQLAAAEVAVVAGGPQLDARMRSVSNNAIYFAGDVVPGTPQLSPVASYEGSMAATNILGRGPVFPQYHATPRAIYTVPALAQVGFTEVEAEAAGVAYTVETHDMLNWRSARTYVEEVAFSKVLLEKNTGKILGAHLLGHGSEETIHAFAHAIQLGLTRDYIRAAPTAYPTFHADLKYLV